MEQDLSAIENTRKWGSDYIIIIKTKFGLYGLEGHSQVVDRGTG